MKLSFKSVVAFLLMASSSFVGAQTLQTLCSFNGTNGAHPRAALTLGNDGNFYGTTENGGITNAAYPSGMGTIFSVRTDGTLTSLASFSGTNGARPGKLTMGNDANFYGTTLGTDEFTRHGSVFQVTRNGTLTLLDKFSSATGAYPGALTLGNDGSFYGTTLGTDPLNGNGNVFKVTTNGTLTSLLFFPCCNVRYPNDLALGNDGDFYATSSGLGTAVVKGTLFKVTTNGSFTPLATFYSTNGVYPVGALRLGNDGNFYGATGRGGAHDRGTIFRATTNGLLTTLYSFTGGANRPGLAMTTAGLTLGMDGNFYGTTYYLGDNDQGMVFKVTTNGSVTTLYSFTGGANGANPYAGLTLGNDGNLYGTTYYGGNQNQGTVFRLSIPRVEPPRLTLQFSSGSPLLSLYGMLSNNFVVQYTANLEVTNWIHLRSVTNLSSSPYQFVDPPGGTEPARFYRAFMQ